MWTRVTKLLMSLESFNRLVVNCRIKSSDEFGGPCADKGLAVSQLLVEVFTLRSIGILMYLMVSCPL